MYEEKHEPIITSPRNLENINDLEHGRLAWLEPMLEKFLSVLYWWTMGELNSRPPDANRVHYHYANGPRIFFPTTSLQTGVCKDVVALIQSPHQESNLDQLIKSQLLYH